MMTIETFQKILEGYSLKRVLRRGVHTFFEYDYPKLKYDETSNILYIIDYFTSTRTFIHLDEIKDYEIVPNVDDDGYSHIRFYADTYKYKLLLVFVVKKGG